MAEQVIPTKKMPPGLQVENVDDRIMTLNVGPQHPGSGHMRIIVQIDGDLRSFYAPTAEGHARWRLAVLSYMYMYSSNKSISASRNLPFHRPILIIICT